MSEIFDDLNYSDFDFFKINLPDGTTRIFDNELSFNDFCDSRFSVINLSHSAALVKTCENSVQN